MKIIIIDDDPLVAMSLKTITEASGIEVVGIGHNSNQAFSLFKKHQPDIVLMDIRMPGENGVEASERILKQDPHAKILFLTTFLDDEYILKAMKLGVKGYILKQNYESIISSLEAVDAGQHVFNTEIIQKIPDLMQEKDKSPSFPNLTSKEIQFLTLVASGLNNKEIANELFLSEGTVRNYLSSLLDKLNLRDRTQLAIYYYQHT